MASTWTRVREHGTVRWLRRNAEWYVAPLFFTLMVLYMYRHIWWGIDGRLHWFGWDTIESYWPDLSYFASSLGEGDWPLWNPYDRAGYSFHGDTVYGMYYPVTWALVAPGAALGEMPAWVGQLKHLLHWIMGATFLYAYLRTRKLPIPAAAFGGVAWIASLPMIIHKASALNWPLVWAPIVWIAIDRLIERIREPNAWRRAAALAGAIGIAGSSGPPPGFFYLLVVSIMYGAFRLGVALLDAYKTSKLRNELRLQAQWLAVAGVWTALLLLVVVLPGMAIADDSFTRGTTRSLQYALHRALPVEPTLQGLFLPNYGKIDSYLGIMPIMLGLAALIARPLRDRGMPVFLLVAAAFVAVLSFGGNTPLLPWCVKHLPGFGLFREPNRYKCVTAMVMAALAAYGIAALLSADISRRRRLLAIITSVAAVLLLILWAKTGKHLPVRHRNPGTVGTTLAVTIIGAALSVLIALRVRWKVIGIAAACALSVVTYWDVWTYGKLGIRLSERPVDDQEDWRFLEGLGNVTTEWRVFDEFVMEQRPGSRLRIRNFRGYPSLPPFTDARYAEVMFQVRKTPELLAAFNVRWVLHGPHHRNGKRGNFIKRPPNVLRPRHFRRLDAKRYETVLPAPQVQWYGRVKLVPDKKKAMAALLAQERVPGTRNAAIVERPDIAAATAAQLSAMTAPGSKPVVGSLTSYGADRISFTVDAPAAGVVVLNEKMSAGWEVSVDGKAATPLRANYMLRGVFVQAGRHSVTWEYRPHGYWTLFSLWLFALLGIIAAGVLALRDRHRLAKAAAIQ